MSETVHAPSTNEPQPGRLGANYFKLFWASTISNLGDGIAIIAYPWLASAITRNPFLIALVAVVQRLPWLIFSLPAGVVTDRVDRRTIIVRANVVRAFITLGVAFAVLARQDMLPGPNEISDASTVITTDVALYVVILVATVLLGIAEVFADNASQTFMPSIVHADDLEKANGRLWSTEQIANTFAGPPLGALLIAVAFALPFFVDAGTFIVAAALVSLIPATVRRTDLSQVERKPWKDELVEGFQWLWGHDFLKWLAIILGLVNALGMMSFAVLVLFAQEVLDTSATEFAILNTGGALGGIIGGWTASTISKRIGPGPSLYTVLIGGGITTALIGVVAWWPFTWLMFAIYMLFAVLWNVITVSLRQTIIPDHLLGRVNSVYRFFGWGMMPIGSILGGLVVVSADMFVDRDLALRMPWFVAGALHIVLFVFAAPKLTTARIESARAEGIAANTSGESAGDQGSS
jgi:MFS family permease